MRISLFSRMALSGLTAIAASLAVPTAAQTPAKPAAKPAAPAPRKAPARKPAAPVVVVLPPAGAEQLAAADMAHVGDYACEFNQKITVLATPQQTGYIDVRFNKSVWTMKPVLSSTGALRLEDVKGQMLMIQIANKSMVMDTKIGHRIVDACVHEKQLQAIAAAASQPAGPPLLQAPETAASAAASAASAADTAAVAASVAASAAGVAASAAATAASAASAAASAASAVSAAAAASAVMPLPAASAPR